MFAKWGSLAYRRRWVVLVATVLLSVTGGVWGLGVFDRLSQGGYEAPGSEAVRARQVAEEAFGRQGGDVLVVYRGAVTNPAVAKKITDRLRALPTDAVLPHRPLVPAADGTKALAVLTLSSGDSNTQMKQFDRISGQLAVDGLSCQVGGVVPTQKAISEMSERDVTRAEAISLPIVLILLVIIFGGLVAASLPVLVGGLAITGSLGVLHAISLGVDVNSFAVNVASLLGLGMAIDYGLFMVGRFREELAAGRGSRGSGAPHRRHGRAVRSLFSATLLMIALAGLLLFPQGFLKSLSLRRPVRGRRSPRCVSLTLLPALLAILGHRVDKLPVRLPRPQERRSRPSSRLAPARPAWCCSRPVLVAVPIIAVLLVLAAPFLGVQFGEVDEKVLPEGNPARVRRSRRSTSDFPRADQRRRPDRASRHGAASRRPTRSATGQGAGHRATATRGRRRRQGGVLTASAGRQATRSASEPASGRSRTSAR